jgi:zinc/manganese transport system substrate-binding protein
MDRRVLLRGVALVAAAFVLAVPASGHAADKLKVVASFSILGDIVANVGGDRIAVTTLVGPDGDAHVYEPSPSDASAVAGADLVVVNGLGFEGWLDRLIAASGYAGPVVVASAGVSPRAMAEEGDEHADEEHAEVGHEGEEHADEEHAGEEHAEDDHAGDEHDADHAHHDHGDLDPHAWQDLANGRIYVNNIAAALSAADPAGAETYRANAAAYLAEIDALESWVKAELGGLSEESRTIVTSHDAFGYFAAAYGLRFVAPVAFSTEAEPSAADVAALINQLKAEKIKAVFVENISNPRIVEQIGREAGAAVGGTLFSDALSQPGGPADTYLQMFRYNVGQLKGALS